jgi:protocatechuate 3,4-dioxygenase beta subunit
MSVGAAGAVVAACGGDGGSSESATSTAAPSATRASAIATSGGTTTPASALSCIVSPEMTEGPYFVDEMLNRSDIRSDPSDGSTREGVPVRLTVNVSQVNEVACTPIAGAQVDIWHCDAVGVYSDVAGSESDGQKFLRGYQVTDESGNVEFTTIYPGWYMGRAVHIHVKVRTDPEAQQGYEFTSQFFFDDALSEQVYANAAYGGRGSPDTPNSADGIYQGGGQEMTLALTAEGGGYAGTFNIGLQMA